MTSLVKLVSLLYKLPTVEKITFTLGTSSDWNPSSVNTQLFLVSCWQLIYWFGSFFSKTAFQSWSTALSYIHSVSRHTLFPCEMNSLFISSVPFQPNKTKLSCRLRVPGKLWCRTILGKNRKFFCNTICDYQAVCIKLHFKQICISLDLLTQTHFCPYFLFLLDDVNKFQYSNNLDVGGRLIGSTELSQTLEKYIFERAFFSWNLAIIGFPFTAFDNAYSLPPIFKFFIGNYISFSSHKFF